MAYGSSVIHLASWWNLQAAGPIALGAAQLALLLSPAVYLRTRLGRWPGAVTGTVPPEAELRLRPPRWILEAAVVTGPVIAAGLAAADRSPGQTALALGQHCAGWALGSFTVLYLLWLSQHSRPESLRPAVAPTVPVPVR